MTEENNNTAATVTDQTEHSNIITIQTTLGDEGRNREPRHSHTGKTRFNTRARLFGSLAEAPLAAVCFGCLACLGC